MEYRHRTALTGHQRYNILIVSMHIMLIEAVLPSWTTYCQSVLQICHKL